MLEIATGIHWLAFSMYAGHPCEPLNLTEISHTFMMVNISWQPPLCEGDPAFDEYEVEIASDDTGFSATQTTDPTTVHCVFDDLAPGTQYNFTVYAVIRELSETSAPSNKLTVSTDGKSVTAVLIFFFLGIVTKLLYA